MNLNSTFIEHPGLELRSQLNLQLPDRTSKLIYLNPNDYLSKADSTASSPNHYSNSSSDDTSSSSSDCVTSSQQSNSSNYAMPPDNLGSESPYRLEPMLINGAIYQTLKRVGSGRKEQNYLECIDKLMEEENVTQNREKNTPIYSNKTDLLTRNRNKNYEDHSQITKHSCHVPKNSVSFRVKPKTNQNLLHELLRNSSHAGTLKPVPPSRSSSLQYRNRTMHPSASLFIYKKTEQQTCHSNSSSDGDESSAMTESVNQVTDDSIYSSFSLRMSRLSSFNLGNHTNESLKKNTEDTLITKSEHFRIESFYKSIGSTIYACNCPGDFYTTDLQCLIKLLDWQHQFNGIPVWVFNTGLNPKRPKGLSLVIADKKTGFASLRLNRLSHLNDLKWTKPGHLTLKIYPQNLSEHLINNPLLNPISGKQKRVKTSSTTEDFSGTLRRTAMYPNTNQTFSNYSELTAKMAEINKSQSGEGFIFAAIRFNNDFECSKFYDFYRNLFVDSQNDDLFNPHYAAQRPAVGKMNMMKVFLKKITKNSISSPVAFQHVNSLSMVGEK